jgi:hypothetical protein
VPFTQCSRLMQHHKLSVSHWPVLVYYFNTINCVISSCCEQNHFMGRYKASISAQDSLSPVSEGFVGDPWLSITLTLCHILHSVSHWPVLVYFIISAVWGWGNRGHLTHILLGPSNQTSQHQKYCSHTHTQPAATAAA